MARLRGLRVKTPKPSFESLDSSLQTPKPKQKEPFGRFETMAGLRGSRVKIAKPGLASPKPGFESLDSSHQNPKPSHKLPKYAKMGPK